MQPNLFPPPGTIIRDMPGAMNLMQELARQAAASATIEVDGMMADIGAHGVRLSNPLPTQVQCFEITSCWRSVNPPPKSGATHGVFWVCDAVPLTYFRGTPEDTSSQDDIVTRPANANCDCDATAVTEDSSTSAGDDPDMHSYWAKSELDPIQIFWAVSSPADAEKWQKMLYPLYGIGQWVWCVFDYQADVWRMICATDNVVRFQLMEAMRGCGAARARVIGFACGQGSSSSSEYSYYWPEESSSSSSSSNSGLDAECMVGALDRGAVWVYDILGIVNVMFTSGTAPACSTGWARWCSDKERLEVISYGSCSTGTESETGEVHFELYDPMEAYAVSPSRAYPQTYDSALNGGWGGYRTECLSDFINVFDVGHLGFTGAVGAWGWGYWRTTSNGPVVEVKDIQCPWDVVNTCGTGYTPGEE